MLLGQREGYQDEHRPNYYVYHSQCFVVGCHDQQRGVGYAAEIGAVEVEVENVGDEVALSPGGWWAGLSGSTGHDEEDGLEGFGESRWDWDPGGYCRGKDGKN